MPRIIVEFPEGEKKEYPIDKDIATIGRRKHCNIVLKDTAASRHHATIELRDGTYLLRDEGSANGTMVGGERITEHKLHDGDRITIGGSTLTFRMEEPEPTPPPREERRSTATTRRMSSRRRSSRRLRGKVNVKAARAEVLRQEVLIKLICMGISGAAFVAIFVFIVRLAFRETGGDSRPTNPPAGLEERIRTLQDHGRKALAEKNYRRALDNYEACFNLCKSLRERPEYVDEGFYWLEQVMQECLTKIQECKNQMFRREMRTRRGVD